MRSKFILILAWISALLSVWHIFFIIYEWLTLSYSIDKFYMWLTRVLYVLPKLGVVLGLISMYKFRSASIKIYSASWLLGTLHTVVYYAMGNVSINAYEQIILVIHHVLPQAFYICMLVLLYQTVKLTNQARGTPKSVAPS
jgi:hypothetical protein